MGPDEPAQVVPEIDVSDKQQEADRQNKSKAVTYGSEHGIQGKQAYDDKLNSKGRGIGDQGAVNEQARKRAAGTGREATGAQPQEEGEAKAAEADASKEGETPAEEPKKIASSDDIPGP